MITMRQIEDISGRIAAEFEADAFCFSVLRLGCALAGFGCGSAGNPVFEGKAVAKSVEMRLKIKPPFPVDLLVRTPEKIRERLALGDPFIGAFLRRARSSMKPTAAESVDKAEGDSQRRNRKQARKNPNYDGVCLCAIMRRKVSECAGGRA